MRMNAQESHHPIEKTGGPGGKSRLEEVGFGRSIRGGTVLSQEAHRSRVEHAERIAEED